MTIWALSGLLNGLAATGLTILVYSRDREASGPRRQISIDEPQALFRFDTNLSKLCGRDDRQYSDSGS